MIYVFSTHSQSINFSFFDMVGDMPIRNTAKSIIIKGGAGIPSDTSGYGIVSKSESGRPIWTPEGHVTPLSESDYERLKGHKKFIEYLEKGYFKVLNSDISDNSRQISKNAAQMEHDGFGLLTKDNIDKRIKVSIGLGQQEDSHRL